MIDAESVPHPETVDGEFSGGALASAATDVLADVAEERTEDIGEARTRAERQERMVQRQVIFSVGAGAVGAVATGTAAWHVLARWPHDIPLGSPASCVSAVALCLCLIGGRGLWRLTRVWRRQCPSVDCRTGLHRRVVEIASESWSRAAPFAVAAAVAWRYGLPQMSSRWFLAGLAGGAGFPLVGVAALRVRFLLLDRGRLPEKLAARPLDPLITDLADIVACARALEKVWYRPDVSRFLVNRVEGLARSAEALRIAGRAPLTELALRQAGRDDLTRLAAAVRLHKRGFASARSAKGHSHVTDALATGLAAMLDDDWPALLAKVPALGPRRRWIHPRVGDEAASSDSLITMSAPGSASPRPRPVRRVVSLVPSLTEAVAATAPDLLVGATAWCTHPTDLDVERIGGTKNPDTARIIELAPDLVIANEEENRVPDLDALRAAGLPVWVTQIRTLEEAFESLDRLLTLGCGLERPVWLDEAESAWLAATATATAPTEAVTAIIPIWRRPWMVVGRDTFAGDVLARLGVRNIYADHADRYPAIPLPELLESEAQIVVLPDEPYAFSPTDGPEAFPNRPAALVSGRHLTWYGPSLVEAAEVLADQLRPALTAARG